ncbi:MAG: TonB-dependent receptor, partial [Campylobacterales bacterium]|nr:TonB-dependent receptor [Campylobacterales bacterium]
MKKSILFLCMALSLFSVEKLGKMEVITGTRTLKLLSESPVKTEVVTAKDIEISHAKSVDEALRYVPGLMVKETHGKQGSSIWIQGVNSDRVLILLDGEPMVASTGSTVDLSQINVGDISRIEIIKGASSALYGSKAMGGVINIISAEPKHGVHHKVKVEAGSYFNKGSENLGEGFVRTSSSYKDKKSAFTLDFDYRYESGVKLKEGYTEQLPGFTKVNLNSDLRFYGDINFRIIPRIYSEETSKDYTEYVPGGGNQNYEKREDTKKYRLTIEGDTEFENSKLKVTETIEQYYGTSETDNLGSSYIEQKRDADIGFYKREFQYDNTLNESHVITLGGTYVYEDLEQVNTKTSNTKIDRVNELGKSQKREGRELFIQDDWFVFEDLEIIPGLRYQNDSGFGDYTAPKIAAMYSGYFDDGQRVNLRLSYGNGYKVPTLKERYFVFD